MAYVLHERAMLVCSVKTHKKHQYAMVYSHRHCSDYSTPWNYLLASSF